MGQEVVTTVRLANEEDQRHLAKVKSRNRLVTTHRAVKAAASYGLRVFSEDPAVAEEEMARCGKGRTREEVSDERDQ